MRLVTRRPPPSSGAQCSCSGSPPFYVTTARSAGAVILGLGDAREKPELCTRLRVGGDSGICRIRAAEVAGTARASRNVLGDCCVAFCVARPSEVGTHAPEAAWQRDTPCPPGPVLCSPRDRAAPMARARSWHPVTQTRWGRVPGGGGQLGPMFPGRERSWQETPGDSRPLLPKTPGARQPACLPLGGALAALMVNVHPPIRERPRGPQSRKPSRGAPRLRPGRGRHSGPCLYSVTLTREGCRPVRPPGHRRSHAASGALLPEWYKDERGL